ncbi:M4 family metallopeptidase [Pendulispora albinea]|uniref:Neutral metalloproteinase n=1 Tax=Pendulispora albinea TaxID=2741071 RepID=A0ABZ2M1G7_9BACT
MTHRVLSNKNRRNWLLPASLTLLACAPLACSGNTDVSDTSSPAAKAIDALPQAEVIATDEATGVPTYIGGHLGVASLRDPGTENDVRAALATIAPVFHANAADLVLKSTDRDALGDVHYRYTQFKNGLEVIGGELLVHSRGGVLYGANGSARDDLPAPAKASLSPQAAVGAAYGAYASLAGAELTAEPKAELAYRPSYDGDALLLVYKVTVQGTEADGTPILDTVLVNAVSGAIVDRIPSIHTAKNREVHNLNGSTVLPGPVARTETGPASSDSIVNTNFNLLGTTYDAYSTLFNRDSINGRGSKLISSVHYSRAYNNAFWNGTQMVYGDGDGRTFSNLATSLDVTAHELTHGVTTATSNLIYSNQSGGLNESVSDIFGQVTQWFGAGKVISPGIFQVGEDIFTPGTPGDALRYLNDPKKDGRSLDFFADYRNGIDVHFSSGISNLAFFLLAQGGKHPRGRSTVQVTGIGIERAAQIFYRANTSIFTASTTFAQAKTWTKQAATQLGYPADVVDSVDAAWRAVGVN